MRDERTVKPLFFRKHGRITRSFLLKLALSILLIASFVQLIVYLNAYIDEVVDSDMSSELILSKMLNDEGSAMTPKWIYSTELRVLNTQLIFAPLFSVFSDWHMVRVVGTAILWLILLASYGYFCKQMKVEDLFLWTAPFLFLPLSSDYSKFVLIGAYYIPHVSISFAVLGLILHAGSVGQRKTRICLLVTLSVLSCLAGMGGLRQLLVTYIPLMCWAVLLCLKEYLSTPTDARPSQAEKRLLFDSLLSTFCAVLGYLVNDKIYSKIYRFLHHDGIHFTKISLDRFQETLNGVLTNLGYQNKLIFSTALIRNFACFLLVVFVTMMFIRSWKLLGGGITKERLVCMFPLIALIIFICFYSITDMGYNSRYNLPFLAYIIPAVGIYLKEVRWKKYLKAVLCGFIGISAILSSLQLYHVPHKEREINTIAQQLVEMGYREGYATFWNGPLITELTDGQIKIRTLDSDDLSDDVASIDQLHLWLSPVSDETTRPKGSVFVLFSNQETKKFTLGKAMARHYSDQLVYQSPAYDVYGFQSYDDIDFVYNMEFTDNRWLRNGADANGVRTVRPGGVSYGPYLKLEAGAYRIEIDGEGLETIDLRVTTDSGKNILQISHQTSLPQQRVVKFTTDVPLEAVECRIENISDTPLTIRRIEFFRDTAEAS